MSLIPFIKKRPRKKQTEKKPNFAKYLWRENLKGKKFRMNNAHTNLKLYLDVVWFTSFIMLVCRRRPFYPILNETSVLCSALLLQPLLLLLCCGWCVFSYTKYFLFSRVLFFFCLLLFHFILFTPFSAVLSPSILIQFNCNWLNVRIKRVNWLYYVYSSLQLLLLFFSLFFYMYILYFLLD